MNQPAYPSFPHDRISFRTTYWLFFISLAAVVWVSLSNKLGLNAESREVLDEANWHNWIDQKFVLKALLFRPAGWVLEELIFRGFLLQWLRRHLPTWAALLVSAVLFSALHWAKGPQTMAIAFILAFYLGWLLIRTNSIYAPIIAHFSINFAAFYVVWPLMAASGRLSQGGAGYPGWSWGLSAAVIIVGLLILRREFRLAPLRPLAQT